MFFQTGSHLEKEKVLGVGRGELRAGPPRCTKNKSLVETDVSVLERGAATGVSADSSEHLACRPLRRTIAPKILRKLRDSEAADVRITSVLEQSKVTCVLPGFCEGLTCKRMVLELAKYHLHEWKDSLSQTFGEKVKGAIASVALAGKVWIAVIHAAMCDPRGVSDSLLIRTRD